MHCFRVQLAHHLYMGKVERPAQKAAFEMPMMENNPSTSAQGGQMTASKHFTPPRRPHARGGGGGGQQAHHLLSPQCEGYAKYKEAIVGEGEGPHTTEGLGQAGALTCWLQRASMQLDQQVTSWGLGVSETAVSPHMHMGIQRLDNHCHMHW